MTKTSMRNLVKSLTEVQRRTPQWPPWLRHSAKSLANGGNKFGFTAYVAMIGWKPYCSSHRTLALYFNTDACERNGSIITGIRMTFFHKLEQQQLISR